MLIFPRPLHRVMTVYIFFIRFSIRPSRRILSMSWLRHYSNNLAFQCYQVEITAGLDYKSTIIIKRISFLFICRIYRTEFYTSLNINVYKILKSARFGTQMPWNILIIKFYVLLLKFHLLNERNPSKKHVIWIRYANSKL